MMELLHDIVKNPLFNIVWGLIGFLIGNKSAIGRDKRKEFNELISPIRIDLIAIKIHHQGTIKGEYMITFTLIREMFPFWKRKGFDRAIDNYHKRKSEYGQSFRPDGMGGRIAGDKTAACGLAVSHAANVLLRYLKPK